MVRSIRLIYDSKSAFFEKYCCLPYFQMWCCLIILVYRSFFIYQTTSSLLEAEVGYLVVFRDFMWIFY